MEKGSGILLHVSSLPSKHGIGTFGKEARSFIRFLNEAGQKYWQILPLNPTSYGDSPYQSFSAFAINPYFIDLDLLVKEKLLDKKDVRKIRGGSNPHYVDYGKIYNERYDVLRIAYKNGYDNLKEEVTKFAKKQKHWIEDYALFMLIKDLNGGKSWQEWPREQRMHRRKVLEEIKNIHQDEYNFWIFLQFLAHQQYSKLRKYAKRKGVKIIGDMPIYVALDSADVWGNAKLFQLDSKRRPVKVAGVPPDFFSETGQLWGNPIYDYAKCKKTKYLWWRRRVKAMAKLYDLLRIDHFRGFESYWAVPADEETAINGKWEKGPGYELFEYLNKATPKLQIIAEDLGVITDEVRELKAKTGFPGLKIYQFAFDDYYQSLNAEPEDKEEKADVEEQVELSPQEIKEKKLVNSFLPHNYEKNCVAYLGTHDNDVMTNFIEEHVEQQKAMLDYLNIWRPEDILDTLIGSLMRSNADVVIFMPQDILHLDKYTRMNTPGVATGNWQFRLDKKLLSKELSRHLRVMTEEAKRI